MRQVFSSGPLAWRCRDIRLKITLGQMRPTAIYGYGATMEAAYLNWKLKHETA